MKTSSVVLNSINFKFNNVYGVFYDPASLTDFGLGLFKDTICNALVLVSLLAFFTWWRKNKLEDTEDLITRHANGSRALRFVLRSSSIFAKIGAIIKLATYYNTQNITYTAFSMLINLIGYLKAGGHGIIKGISQGIKMVLWCELNLSSVVYMLAAPIFIDWLDECYMPRGEWIKRLYLIHLLNMLMAKYRGKIILKGNYWNPSKTITGFLVWYFRTSSGLDTNGPIMDMVIRMLMTLPIGIASRCCTQEINVTKHMYRVEYFGRKYDIIEQDKMMYYYQKVYEYTTDVYNSGNGTLVGTVIYNAINAIFNHTAFISYTSGIGLVKSLTGLYKLKKDGRETIEGVEKILDMPAGEMMLEQHGQKQKYTLAQTLDMRLCVLMFGMINVWRFGLSGGGVVYHSMRKIFGHTKNWQPGWLDRLSLLFYNPEKYLSRSTNTHLLGERIYIYSTLIGLGVKFICLWSIWSKGLDEYHKVVKLDQ